MSGSDWAHIAAAAVRAVLWILLLSTPVTAGLTLAGDRQPLTLLAGMQFDPTPLIGSWSWTKTIDWGDVHTFMGEAIVGIAGFHAAAALVHHFI